MEFGEDADSELQELIMATVSQHQRRKNAEQTVNRMQARLKSGLWVFFAPVGYRYAKTSGSGKVLVRDEPLASIVQEALEGYASGRFETQAEVKRFLERFPEYPRDRHGEVRNQRVKELLTRIVYAGYVDYAEWDVRMVRARHEGLIDLTTYERIQERLTGRAQAPARKDKNADFPLWGFVVCGDCGNPLSACWSRSKTGKRHPYYLCHNKGCPSHRKSVRRDEIESEFERVLKKMQPTEALFSLCSAMFRDAWDQFGEQARAAAIGLREEIDTCERKVEQLLERIMNAENPTVIAAYEAQIGKLEREKTIKAEKLQSIQKPRHAYEELFELALTFLSKPWKIWASGRLDLRRTVCVFRAIRSLIPTTSGQAFRGIRSL
ncbi:MAG: recombinase zinc beta ribbon domain-containing protein [Pseudomonadota bacterium]